VSLRVAEGELCVLIGPSGCGKSTTLRLINRLVEPTSGEVFLNGKPVRDFAPEKLRRGIGYVIQSIGLLPHMSVEENISIVPDLLRWDQERTADRVVELLELVGLDAEVYRAKYPSQLSGGEAQRIGVARALAADPPVLLMDEPFGAVDPLNRETLQNEFLSIHRKLRKSVVFVTHDLDEAVRLADHVVVMRAGAIVQQGAPEALLERPENEFVQSFVGSDRVLKRLSRFLVEDHTEPGEPRLMAGTGGVPYVTPADDEPAEPVWLVDDSDRLVGMSIRGDNRIYHPPEPFWVHPSGSLREALSLMLYLHVKRLAVVDNHREFIGEITLAQIHAVTKRSAGKRDS
jgi:osmoprotectant transport system ATP-binding protein